MLISMNASSLILRDSFSLLAQVDLYILVALAGHESSAYGLADRIQADSTGGVLIARPTIKSALPRLVLKQLIEQIGPENSTYSGKMSQPYRKNEQRRLRQLTRVLDGRLIAREHGLI
jgi:DNA-binding PadR family transcriptional regulator